MTFIDLPRGVKAQRIVWALCSISGEMYGMQICREADLAPGTTYPALARLLREGWISDRWEEGTQESLGRPPRRYYRLTTAAADFLNPL
jgi:DNA-binding PadR family transcriptional regulator